MKLKCIIVEDEPAGRKILQEFIEEIDFLELTGNAENPLKAISLLNNNPIDLIFLDIQMPKINGINFLKSLYHPPMVIFTTAFSKYALQGFELDIVDYLLKPISMERFLKACHKAKEFYELRQNSGKSPENEINFFFVKCNNIYEKIQYEDVLFVEALENFVSIQTKKKKFITWLTLKNLLESLPQDQFIKIHRSYIISLSKIESIEGNEVKIAGGYSLPISRTNRDGLLKTILNKRLLKR